jgi:hypothetical protein
LPSISSEESEEFAESLSNDTAFLQSTFDLTNKFDPEEAASLVVRVRILFLFEGGIDARPDAGVVLFIFFM